MRKARWRERRMEPRKLYERIAFPGEETDLCFFDHSTAVFSIILQSPVYNLFWCASLDN
jgi:hypothetical protein